MKPARLVRDPWDVNQRLKDLGLNEDDLVRCGERGLAAFLSCTSNHPPAVPGIWAWGETISALGEYLKPLGWSRLDESNWPLVVNEEQTIAISVATGNGDTGCDGENDPVTTSAKGPQTRGAVAVNRRQMHLFDDVPPEVLSVKGRQTWLLLVHRDTDNRELRIELARPLSFDQRGRINTWGERILLSKRSFDGIGDVLLGGGNESQSPEIDIEIKRRG